MAKLIDQAGVPIARIADQRGHSDAAMTASVYLGRDQRTGQAAAQCCGNRPTAKYSHCDPSIAGSGFLQSRLVLPT